MLFHKSGKTEARQISLGKIKLVQFDDGLERHAVNEGLAIGKHPLQLHFPEQFQAFVVLRFIHVLVRVSGRLSVESWM